MTIDFDDLDDELDDAAPQEHRDLVDELCEVEFGLSQWEVEFVESLARTLERGFHLTQAQYDKGTEILNRVQSLDDDDSD